MLPLYDDPTYDTKKFWFVLYLPVLGAFASVERENMPVDQAAAQQIPALIGAPRWHLRDDRAIHRSNVPLWKVVHHTRSTALSSRRCHLGAPSKIAPHPSAPFERFSALWLPLGGRSGSDGLHLDPMSR